MAFSAQNLENRTKRFAIAIAGAARDECRRPDQWNAFSQLVRSAGSVGANHRAMSRSRSAREFAAKLQIVCEEVDEACYWLEVLTADLPDSGPLAPLLAEAKELRAIFAKARSTTRAKLKPSPTG